MDAFKIDGKSFDVPILKYQIEPQILDGEGTGRTAGVGWDMVRDPQGTLVNATVSFGVLDSSDSDFVDLYNKIMSLGVVEFISVTLTLPVGLSITQDMYCSPKNIVMQRMTKDGVTYWGQWDCSFIARSAYIT